MTTSRPASSCTGAISTAMRRGKSPDSSGSSSQRPSIARTTSMSSASVSGCPWTYLRHSVDLPAPGAPLISTKRATSTAYEPPRVRGATWDTDVGEPVLTVGPGRRLSRRLLPLSGSSDLEHRRRGRCRRPHIRDLGQRGVSVGLLPWGRPVGGHGLCGAQDRGVARVGMAVSSGRTPPRGGNGLTAVCHRSQLIRVMWCTWGAEQTTIARLTGTAAVLCILGVGARIAFAIYAEDGGSPVIARFSTAYCISRRPPGRLSGPRPATPEPGVAGSAGFWSPRDHHPGCSS